ncbi:MAG TPA: TrbG/VirB9 family P-type conjugative transfer protein [Candidatus Omnitrophota bacterium]|nr:TrbG/VirB9 family P-type conjugative transfer protein [Candidatus Omnitrophota bacterium]
MRWLLIVGILCLSLPGYAYSDTSVLGDIQRTKDIVRVYVHPEYVTKLEFADEIMLVVAGDNSLLHIELSGDKKGVLIKPMDRSGETNLIIDTLSRKFTYEIVVSDEKPAVYRLDTAQK